ncbi:histidine phosphatase family protein [Legionella fallonii]|nr:histidine phosphatase family protein [Legionella fallonii]
MPRLKLWLIRHGETEVNTGVWSAKPSEAHLTSLGRGQAKKAATEITEQPDLLIVSPLVRAKETAEFLLNQWPNTSYQIWPIQEFIYLSPYRLQSLSPLARKEEIKRYWQKSDPYYNDGNDAECFAAFLQRVAYFHNEIIKQQGFVVVIGHGQFFKAYQMGLTHGFAPNSEWMSLFRQQETANPIKNGEICKLNFT